MGNGKKLLFFPPPPGFTEDGISLKKTR